jgi:hypothetical protein
VPGTNEGYSFTGLAAATYWLQLKDSAGCVSEAVKTAVLSLNCPITSVPTAPVGCKPPAFLNNQQIVKNASCSGSDGAIYIIPTSGTGPFLYSKNGGKTYYAGPDAGYSFENLTVGTYQLRLRDSNGCESEVVTRTVSSPGCPVTSIPAPPANCTPPTLLNDGTIVRSANCGASDAVITVIPTSGAAPFLYSINGGQTYVSGPNAGYSFMNLPSGTYQLRLRDALGCQSKVVQREVKESNCSELITKSTSTELLSEMSKEKEVLTIFPNPSTGQFKVQLQNYVTGQVQVYVLDTKGAILQQRRENVNINRIIDFNLSGKAQGLYFVKVVSNQGTKVSTVLIR